MHRTDTIRVRRQFSYPMVRCFSDHDPWCPWILMSQLRDQTWESQIQLIPLLQLKQQSSCLCHLAICSLHTLNTWLWEMTQFLFPFVDYFKLNSSAANNNKSHTNRCFILHSYFTSLFQPLHLVDLEILQGECLLSSSPLKSRPTVVDLQMLMKTETVLVSVCLCQIRLHLTACS